MPIILDDRGKPIGCEWWMADRYQCAAPASIEIPCVGFEAPHRVCTAHKKVATIHCQWKNGGHEG